MKYLSVLYVNNHLAPSFEGENFVSQNHKEETPIDQHL